MTRTKYYRVMQKKGYNFPDRIQMFHNHLSKRGRMVRKIKIFFLPKKGILTKLWLWAFGEIELTF